MVGGMATLLPVLLYLLAPLGIELDAGAYELISVVVSAVSVPLFQYVVLRVVLGNSSGAAKAWVPVSVLLALIEYFVLYVWLPVPPQGGQVVPTIPEVIAAVMLGVAQGLLLAEMLGVRAAVVVWPAANLVGLAVVFILLEIGGLDSAVSVVGALEGNLMVGAIYGGLTGVALAALVRRSAIEPAPAVR